MQHVLTSGLVLVFAAIACGVAPGNDDPPFKFTTKKDEDRVEVKVEKDKATFSRFRSPSGIGRAVIERTGEKWPDVVVLQMRLTGLESFQASNGTIVLDASVSSHADEQRVRLKEAGKEDAALDAKSPYWMGIRKIGSDDKPTKNLPLKDGYFEVPLPTAFFKGNPKSITLEWVDFYRR